MNTFRLSVVTCALLMTGMSACQPSPEAAKPEAAKPEAAKPEATKPKTPAAKPADVVTKQAPKKADASKEIVFNPKTPPPGYKNCHRNHCHKVGGGVASYKQVMAEMGATKIEGVPKMGPMPKAPADVAKPPKDAKKTASGLVTKMLKAGDGKQKPTADSVVSVHYTGWTSDGKGFDSSVARSKPATFPLKRVFPGWTEGIQLMTVGEERRFWVPQELGFNGRPGRPTGTLTFDIELLEIKQ